MKLILTQEINGLGAAGDIVEVKDGYGRNYLLPRKLATPWTKGGQKQVDALTAGRKAREIKTMEEATSFKARLEETAVKVAAKTGAGDRLFGAVTTSEIVEAIKAAGGPDVDRRRIAIKNPIKTLGEHTVAVRLHQDVVANMTIEVVKA